MEKWRGKKEGEGRGKERKRRKGREGHSNPSQTKILATALH